jgi:tRNA(fMet)-specific endonuclease VapC
MYLLDTNTCIQYLNGKSASIERRLMGTRPGDIKLCSVVKAELWYGAARSNNSTRTMEKLAAFFAPYESLPFDDAAAADYGRIRAQLAAASTPMGPNDLMIAAIARSRGLSLISHNVREYSRVLRLGTEDWE